MSRDCPTPPTVWHVGYQSAAQHPGPAFNWWLDQFDQGSDGGGETKNAPKTAKAKCRPKGKSRITVGSRKNTKAPEGTTTGVATGGAIGGTLGLLAGIGALAIPGVGPFIAAGLIMAALAGLGVGGAVGGLIGALVGLGIPEYEAKRYEGRIKEGGILLSVHCDTAGKITRAKELLKQGGAQDIYSSGEASANVPAASKAAAHQ